MVARTGRVLVGGFHAFGRGVVGVLVGQRAEVSTFGKGFLADVHSLVVGLQGVRRQGVLVAADEDVRGAYVLEFALISLFNQFVGDVVAAHKRLGQLLAVAGQFLLELRAGVQLQPLGFHHLHAEGGEKFEIVVDGLLLNDIAFEVVLVVNIGEILHGDALVADGHQHFLVGFRLCLGEKGWHDK